MYHHSQDYKFLKIFLSQRPVCCYVQVTNNNIPKFLQRFPKLGEFDGIYLTERIDANGQDISASIYIYFPEFQYHEKPDVYCLLKDVDFGGRSIMRKNWKLERIRPTKVIWSKLNRMYFCTVNSLDFFESLHDKLNYKPGVNNSISLFDDKMVMLSILKSRRNRDED